MVHTMQSLPIRCSGHEVAVGHHPRHSPSPLCPPRQDTECFPPEFRPGRGRSRFLRNIPEACEFGDMLQGPLKVGMGDTGGDQRQSSRDRPPFAPPASTCKLRLSWFMICGSTEKTLKLLAWCSRSPRNYQDDFQCLI